MALEMIEVFMSSNVTLNYSTARSRNEEPQWILEIHSGGISSEANLLIGNSYLLGIGPKKPTNCRDMWYVCLHVDMLLQMWIVISHLHIKHKYTHIPPSPHTETNTHTQGTATDTKEEKSGDKRKRRIHQPRRKVTRSEAKGEIRGRD